MHWCHKQSKCLWQLAWQTHMLYIAVLNLDDVSFVLRRKLTPCLLYPTDMLVRAHVPFFLRSHFPRRVPSLSSTGTLIWLTPTRTRNLLNTCTALVFSSFPTPADLPHVPTNTHNSSVPGSLLPQPNITPTHISDF